MSNVSISPRRANQWQREAVKKTLAPVIPFKSLDGELMPALTPALGAGASLGVFKLGPDLQDRRLVDALAVIALTVFIHVTVIERFRHQPVEEVVPPKETKVEISLVRPPPPPPPVVQPQPERAPIKDAIPPKPKPKPKKLPPPVVEQPPVQTTAPVTNDAPVQAPPAPSAAPAPVVEKVTQPRSGADYLHNPQPEYPEDAMERGWEGKILLKVHVLPNGKPDSVDVEKSSGHASLDSSAIHTVKGWTFVPAMRGSTPIAGWVTVPITFKL